MLPSNVTTIKNCVDCVSDRSDFYTFIHRVIRVDRSKRSSSEFVSLFSIFRTVRLMNRLLNQLIRGKLRTVTRTIWVRVDAAKKRNDKTWASTLLNLTEIDLEEKRTRGAAEYLFIRGSANKPRDNHLLDSRLFYRILLHTTCTPCTTLCVIIYHLLFKYWTVPNRSRGIHTFVSCNRINSITFYAHICLLQICAFLS